MALNQEIQTPLTLFSGSLSAHTVAAGANQGQLMTIISSSLPSFREPFWNYKIKTETTYITSATQTQMPELRIFLTDTTAYYLIIAYYGIGGSSTTNPPRLGNNATSLGDFDIVTELPDSLTNIVTNWEGTTGPPTTTWPSSNVNNFYFARHIGIAKPTSAISATFTPSLAVSASAIGVTASMGPSIVFWKKI
jgi:hypothetical protein